MYKLNNVLLADILYQETKKIGTPLKQRASKQKVNVNRITACDDEFHNCIHTIIYWQSYNDVSEQPLKNQKKKKKRAFL